jgi:putative transposase
MVATAERIAILAKRGSTAPASAQRFELDTVLDFVFDRCANGQQHKCLTVTDEFTKKGLAIDVKGRIRPLSR